MKTSRFLPLFAALALLASGCASAPFNRSSRIEPDTDFWRGEVYKQEGRIIDTGQMIRELRAVPAQSRELEGYEGLQAGSIVLSAGGGFAFGYGLGKALSLHDTDGAGILIGAGLAAGIVGIVLGSNAHDKLRNAVDLHNARVRAGGGRSSGSGDVDLQSLPAPGAPVESEPRSPTKKGGTWLFSPLGIAYVF